MPSAEQGSGRSHCVPVCHNYSPDICWVTKSWTSSYLQYCTDDLIIFDEEPAGESKLDSSIEKNRTTASDKTVSKQDSSSCLRPILIIKCGHTFHTECINNWFMENREKDLKTCPLCRREMMSNDTRRVFLSFGEE
ncbi:RING-H2 finger protein ATL48 [Orchesella cincta]|uniref:RING-H2 finger protein ATL48 n=1 Tax=Orchesella cincta TaxID=48709 RepID=A0A1D2M801_ORCCI|nr:RING-H2 finger protein ATL48 [Orchesella cincta]